MTQIWGETASEASVEAEPETWFVPDGNCLVLERYGDGCLLFDARSNSTHLVNELVLDVLEALSRGPATIEELVRRLHLDDDMNSDLPEIRRMVLGLDRLGLLYPATP